MDKIWIVETRSKFKKVKIYRNRSQFILNVNINDKDQFIYEYDLVSSISSVDYAKQGDRDIQIRSVLGELDEKEKAILDFIKLYEEYCPNEVKNYNGSIVKNSKKNTVLSDLNKYRIDKKAFARYLVSNRDHFMRISSEIEWYKTILKIHKFRECGISDEKSKENFKIAKSL